MDLTTLDNFNRAILKGYKPERFENSIHCVMPGYFSGNDILFVAQNPGQLKDSVEGDKKYFDAYKNQNFNKLSEYYVEALKSEKGTYGIFINDVYGKEWSKISFTNVLKCPFVNNVIPKDIPRFDILLLQAQISIVNPKIVVAVGSVAKRAIDMLQIERTYKQLNFFHPAYLKRVGRYEEFVKKYHDAIKKLLTGN